MTHILIGVRANGTMVVISHWSYLPRQAEVQQQMERTREPYDTFILCTPTSILRVNGAHQSTARLGQRVPVNLKTSLKTLGCEP